MDEIETKLATAALKQHVAVQDCLVQQPPNSGNLLSLVAYVEVDYISYLSDQVRAEREWLSHISQVWEVAYSAAIEEAEQQGRPMDDPYLNIHSWAGLHNRSEEIHQLMECTASRIRRLGPKRLLEIGCGSGQILTRLAPNCLDYWGTDISDLALRNLRARKPLPNVTLLSRPADDFTGIPTAYFDGVIINSVLEFFPNSDYLFRVLEQALRAVVPGGFVFVGDIPNLALREVYHYAEQASSARNEQSTQHIMQVAQRRLALEQTFCVAPDFFYALPEYWPQISQVEVKLLRGYYYNAISRLHADTHYDVILHVDAKPPVSLDIPWLDWQKEPASIREVIQRLTHSRPQMFGITRLPHSRLLAHLMVRYLLSLPVPPQTAGELRDQVVSMTDGENLESWWNLDRRLSYQVDINWTNSGQDALCDVVFRPSAQGATKPEVAPVFPHRKPANNLIQRHLDQELAFNLVKFLQSKLPARCIPKEFIFVDSLPKPGSSTLSLAIRQ